MGSFVCIVEMGTVMAVYTYFYVIFSLLISRYLCEKLVWSDEFETLNETEWKIRVSTYKLDDFSYYRNSRKNQWVENGVLNLMPTLTADTYGEDFLYNGKLDLLNKPEDPAHPCD